MSASPVDGGRTGDDYDPRLLRVLIGTAFVFAYNNVGVAPLLLPIAAEFDVSAGMVGLLAAAYSVPSVLASHVLGSISDRRGRWQQLVAGTALMTGGTFLTVVSPSFGLLIGARMVTGLGVAMVMPNLNAALADGIPLRRRGRATSILIGVQTSAIIVGVPLGGIVAEHASWRVAMAIVGIVTLCAALSVWRWLPRAPGRSTASVRRLLHTVAFDGPTMANVASAVLGSMFWFTWTTYVIVFFQRTYAISGAAASLLGLTVGVGILVGSAVGGRLGDRLGHKPVLVTALASCGVLVALTTNLPASIAVTGALNLLLCAASGARMPTNTVMLGANLPEARATVFGLTWASISAGTVVGTAAGGVIIDHHGFGVLGIFLAAAVWLSAAIAALFTRPMKPRA